MALLLQSLFRALSDLARPRIWGYLAMPAVFSFLLWLGLAIWGWDGLSEHLLDLPPMNLLIGWGIAWLAHLLAWFGGWFLVLALAYLTAVLFAAIFLLPLLLREVQANHYPDLAAAGSDSPLTGVGNSLSAAVLFALGWGLSLPLWLIPGASLLLPVLLMAWFNRKTFAFDALCVHATTGEWQELRRLHGRNLFLLGALLAILAHVPLLGMFIPAFAALVYLHYGLEALRRLRGEGVIVGEARVIAVE